MSSLASVLNATLADQPADQWLELVAAQVAALRYGVVQVVVHDGRVVQIERTEKLRLDKPWDIATRVGELDVDNDAFPVYANPANSATKAFSWGVGLNWHLNRNVKVNLNYDQTDFKGGAATDLLRKGEKAIFTRAQISF